MRISSRGRIATAGALLLLVASACSASSEVTAVTDVSEPTASTTALSTEVDHSAGDPTPTEAPEQQDPPDDADAPSPSAPRAEFAPLPPTVEGSFEELREQAETSDRGRVEFALAQLSTAIGPIPGAEILPIDDDFPSDLSGAFFTLANHSDLLTEAEAEAVSAVRERLFENAWMAYAEEGEDGDARTYRNGCGSEAAADDTAVLTDRGDTLAEITSRAQPYLRSRLGGLATYPRVFVGDTSGISPRVHAVTCAEGNECDIIIFDRGLFGPESLDSIVAHELFHCWTYVNFLDDGYAVHPEYLNEGLAQWAGEQFVGTGSSYASNSVQSFFEANPFNVLTSSYSAVGFWAEVAALRGGPEALWPAIPGITERGTNGAPSSAYAAALSDIPEDGWAIAAGYAARKPSWGAYWSMADPATDSAGREPIEVDAAGSDTFRSVDPGAQGLYRYSWAELPADEPVLLSLRSAGPISLRWSNGADLQTSADTAQNYCVRSCSCPDGSQPEGDLPTLDADVTDAVVAVLGWAEAPATIQIMALPLCEPIEDLPDLGAPNGGLAGVWQADNAAIVAAFERASGFGPDNPAPLTISGATGSLLMRLDAGGTGSLSYEAVTLYLADSPLQELTLNGGGTFNWGEVEGALRIQGLTYSVSVSSAALGGELVTLSDADFPSGVTELAGVVSGDTMTITSASGTAGEVFFPTSWQRTG